jgi:hypothetical protein
MLILGLTNLLAYVYALTYLAIKIDIYMPYYNFYYAMCHKMEINT